MTADAFEVFSASRATGVRATALRALELGYAPLPVAADGSKRPAVAWAGYTVHRPTSATVGPHRFAA